MLTDRQIVKALIDRDEAVTQQFFFKNCKPLFLSIMHKVFPYPVDYDEFVNEFYLYLMENDAYRLKQFEGRSSIYQWMKVVAIRYFIAKRDVMIDNEFEDNLIDKAARTEVLNVEHQVNVKIDVEFLLRVMPNKRYEYVIRRLVLQDAKPEQVALELCTNVDNLYNIKKRAIATLTSLALNEVEKYEKKNN